MYNLVALGHCQQNRAVLAPTSLLPACPRPGRAGHYLSPQIKISADKRTGRRLSASGFKQTMQMLNEASFPPRCWLPTIRFMPSNAFITSPAAQAGDYPPVGRTPTIPQPSAHISATTTTSNRIFRAQRAKPVDRFCCATLSGRGAAGEGQSQAARLTGKKTTPPPNTQTALLRAGY